MSFTGISNHTAMFLMDFSSVIRLVLLSCHKTGERFKDFANGGDGETVSHEVPLLPQGHSVGKSKPLGEMEQPRDFLRRKASHPACASQVRSRMHERATVSGGETGRVGLRVFRVDDAEPLAEFGQYVSADVQLS